MTYWWLRDGDEDEEDVSDEDLFRDGKIYTLGQKGINAQSLAKRFCDIVDAQKNTDEYRMHCTKIKIEQIEFEIKNQEKLKKYIETKCDVLEAVVEDMGKIGFFATKEKIQKEFDRLDREKRSTRDPYYSALDDTLGKGEKAIEELAKSARKRLGKISNELANLNAEEDDQKAELEQLQMSLNKNKGANALSEVEVLADNFARDYQLFKDVYPDDDLIKKMKGMIECAFGEEYYVGMKTVIGLANKISYGMVKNVFSNERKIEGEGR